MENITYGGQAFEEFNEAYEAPGFAAETLRALHESYVDDEREQHGNIGDKDGQNRCDVWVKYMVGGGPPEHWVYNKKKSRAV